MAIIHGLQSAASIAKEFAAGTLIIFDRDPHYIAAQNLYAVLGETKSDDRQRPQIRIQAIVRRRVYKPGIDRFAPMTVLASECTPLEAFGMRVSKIVRKSSGHHCSFVWVVRDPDLVPTAKRTWQAPICGIESSVMFSSIDDEALAELIPDPGVKMARAA